MKRSLVLLALLVACRNEPATPPTTASAPEPARSAPADHAAEIRQYREEREARLRKDDSWLTLIGLQWLKEGENAIALPKSTAKVGKLILREKKVTLEPAANAGVTIAGKPVTSPTELLADTAEGGPTFIDFGAIRMNVIERAGRYGLRIKDRESAALKNFKGMEYFDADRKWRVEARFEPYNPPKQIPITNIVGQTTPNPSPGAVVFTVDGKEYRLDPILEEPGGDLFLIFADGTTGRETYGGGRYLYVKPAGADGKVVVDFNKAYNPPCVFSPYATCPLPPAQNKLPVRIEAGEKKFEGGHA